jgi:hypothetical protein
MNVGGLLWLISCGSPLFCTMITGRFLLLGITMLVPLACVGLQAAETKEIKFADPPHSYYTRPPQDAFTLWSQRFQKHEVQLDLSGEKARLMSLLKALDIPVTSQLLVYSATSLQAGLIRPSNPRALYFNEEVYVGYVPGGKLEIAAIDPELGPIFSIFNTF